MKSGVLAVVAGCGAAMGGIETQSIAIDIDSTRGEFGREVAFQQFDTQGGTRVLQSVRASWQGDMSMTLRAQSFTPEFIESGTWFADALHLAWLSFFGGGDGGDGDGERGGYIFSLGGVGISNFTGDLTPGTPGPSPFEPGDPGDPIFASVSDSIDSTLAADPADFGFFTGDGTLDGFFGPFTDITVLPPFFGANIDVQATELTQFGTVTLEYEYTVVPAPAGAGLLAIGGLVAARRRR